MQGDDEVYVGLDVSKLKVSVALADAGRDGEVRFLGEVDTSPESIRRLAAKLANAPAARLLLRGRPDRLRPPPAAHRPRPLLRRGRPLADPEAAGRAGQDQPSRRPHPGAPAPRRRAHPGLDPRSRPRGGARAGARTRGRDGGAASCLPAPPVVPAPHIASSAPAHHGPGRTRGGWASRSSSIPPSTSSWWRPAGVRRRRAGSSGCSAQVRIRRRVALPPLVEAFQALRGVAFLPPSPSWSRSATCVASTTRAS